ncbi:hypothetical protein RRG08_007340 [Elysia crispata]|uniref:Uncharacterized protein n=1 Tax=Elysia crispata TaxID=231223 RepID=A0AAE1AQN6_9GAST|nr:hypothetical protein RRG08_007340 [Elysia crispata]
MTKAKLVLHQYDCKKTKVELKATENRDQYKIRFNGDMNNGKSRQCCLPRMPQEDLENLSYEDHPKKIKPTASSINCISSDDRNRGKTARRKKTNSKSPFETRKGRGHLKGLKGADLIDG